MNVFFKKQFKKIQQERARVRLGWDKKDFWEKRFWMTEFNVGYKTYVDLIILSFKVLYKCDAVIQISAQLSGSTTQVCEFLTFKITFLFLF